MRALNGWQIVGAMWASVKGEHASDVTQPHSWWDESAIEMWILNVFKCAPQCAQWLRLIHLPKVNMGLQRTQWHSGIIVKCCLSELGHNVKPKHNYAPAALRTDMTRLCWSGSWNWMKIPTIVKLRPIDLIQQGSASHDIQLSSDNSSDIQLQKSIASRSYQSHKSEEYEGTKI